MKTEACPETEQRTRIDRLLDALRIHTETLQDLAMKTVDRDERSAQPVKDRRATVARRRPSPVDGRGFKAPADPGDPSGIEASGSWRRIPI
jgi:hypothetical protein